jgi:hypothetical protein
VNKKDIKKAVMAGIISGIALGLFLKLIEQSTHLKVYTLLLNLDYVPIINQFVVPEILGFVIHLGISICISIGFLFYIHRKPFPASKKISLAVLLSVIIGLFLFPTTALSTQTPALTNLPALFYWLVGHYLYGLILGLMLKK